MQISFGKVCQKISKPTFEKTSTYFLDLTRFTARFEPVTKTERTDNCGVNVCYFGDKLYALTETPYIRQINSETLDTIGEKVDVH